MPSQTLNKHARKKYDQFSSALDTVRIALDELNSYTKKFADKSDSRFHGWRVPTKKEIRTKASKASAELDGLRKSATAYKSKLIANGWRV